MVPEALAPDLPVPGPRTRGDPLRDGIPAAAGQGQCRRQGGGPDPAPTAGDLDPSIGGSNTSSDCVGTSNRHGAKGRHPVRAGADATRSREQAPGLAVLADQAAHLVEPQRGRLRAREFAIPFETIHRRSGKARLRQGEGAEGGAGRLAGRQDGSSCRAPSRFHRPAWCCWRCWFVSPVGGPLQAFGVELVPRHRRAAAQARRRKPRAATPPVSRKVFAFGDMPGLPVARGLGQLREAPGGAAPSNEFLMGSEPVAALGAPGHAEGGPSESAILGVPPPPPAPVRIRGFFSPRCAGLEFFRSRFRALRLPGYFFRRLPRPSLLPCSRQNHVGWFFATSRGPRQKVTAILGRSTSSKTTAAADLIAAALRAADSGAIPFDGAPSRRV